MEETFQGDGNIVCLDQEGVYDIGKKHENYTD